MRSAPLSFLSLLTIVPCWVSSIGNHSYTAFDDATWAVVTTKLSDAGKQTEYDAFMNACRAHAGWEYATQYCDDEEELRLLMNMYQPRSVSALLD